jgi:hypothetical protein
MDREGFYDLVEVIEGRRKAKGKSCKFQKYISALVETAICEEGEQGDRCQKDLRHC